MGRGALSATVRPLKKGADSGMISAMAVRVTHVVDEGMSEDGVRMLSLLLRRMPSDRVVSRVVIMGRRPAVLEIPDRLRVDHLGGRLVGAASASYALGRCLADRPNEVVLAWGAEARQGKGWAGG